MFAANRFRLGGIAFLILASACAAAPAQAELPASWAPGPIQPSPSTAGAHFGQSLVNAGDLNSDGQDDLVVGAPDYTDSELGSGLSGRVYALTSTGALIWDAKAPFPQASHAGASTGFGTKVAKLEDVGSCTPTGNGCNVGAPDGIAEVLVSAPGTDTSSGAGVDQGVVYVLDGGSGLTLKQVQLSERPASGVSGFGKSLAALSGQPACDTWGGLNSCPYENGSAVALGDVNGGGEPDFAVGAPDFTETDATLEGVCTSVCPGIGRVYVFHGEAITGSSQTPVTEATDPAALTNYFPGAIGEGGTPRYGATLGPVGDSGRCTDTPDPGRPDATCVKPAVPLTNQPDGRPDLVVGAPGVDNPGAVDAGVVFLMDPAANAAMATLQSTRGDDRGAFGSFRPERSGGRRPRGGSQPRRDRGHAQRQRRRCCLFRRPLRAEPVRRGRRSCARCRRSVRLVHCELRRHRRRCAERGRAGRAGRRASRRGSHRERVRVRGAEDDLGPGQRERRQVRSLHRSGRRPQHRRVPRSRGRSTAIGRRCGSYICLHEQRTGRGGIRRLRDRGWWARIKRRDLQAARGQGVRRACCAGWLWSRASGSSAQGRPCA